MPCKPITKEIFINRAINKYGNKYNYTKLIYNGFQNKTIFNCPIHGEFTQTPHEHLRSKHGCQKCGNKHINIKRTFTTEEFIKKSYLIHNNQYDYSLVNYKNANTKVKIICPIHGEFNQEPCNHLRGMGCNKCSQKRTSIKILLQ